jgi:phosphatidylethanolamine-binding protein (PEBP) family uncharacterized protein
MSLVAPLGRLLRSRRADPALGVAGIAELSTAETFDLRSASFEDGAELPLRHAARGRGQNLSPPLTWSGLPEGTDQLLLAVEDVDVPIRRPALHTIALLTPEPGALGEGELVASERVRFVPAMLGSRGYQGPRPLPGHGPHHYGFHLWSLGRAVPVDARPKRLADLLPLVAGHVTAHAVIVGVQES